MNSLILTAGYGNRFKPYTDKLAKPAIEFLTLPMLMYSRYYAEVLQSNSITFNLHHLAETVQSANKQFKNPNINFHYSDETKELLDSGGGITNALKQFYPKDSCVFVSNGDNICLINEGELLKAKQFHEQQSCDVTIMVGKHPQAGLSLSALYADHKGQLQDKGLNRSKDLSPYHFLGMMFFNSKIIPQLPNEAFSLFDDGLLPQRDHLKIQLYVLSDYLWFETGNPEDYLKASFSCMKHMSDTNSNFGALLKKIIKSYRPNVSFSNSDQSLVLSCSELKNSSTEGVVVVGDNCHIDNSHLKNCVIHSEAVIEGQSLDNTFVLF
ncbi:MAG: hypothetical protein MK008_10370 [Bdellovibrionales bacterium]|nr:hypothetical protein [Bdellovibrionales bacterium]